MKDVMEKVICGLTYQNISKNPDLMKMKTIIIVTVIIIVNMIQKIRKYK